ncbi:MAG: hypothetical protein ABMA15_12645 [Vicinamibacterales bacterium]
MIFRSGHVKDSRLFACYVDERAGDPLDPRVADHLATCADCADRFQDLAAMMNELRESADAEAEAVFSPTHLEEQRQQILRRLEHVNRPARVISFPGRDAAADTRPAGLMAPRWVAAAAAAGLFIGFAAGGYLGPERLHRSRNSSFTQSAPPAVSVQRVSSAPAIRVGAAQPEPADDDAFLIDLETALVRHARELQPFDAMTPYVTDVDSRGR